ncbi:MAG: Rho termination factor N-terminal domain-containing protein, partial [Gemmatales bacterium]|nr:Rho termination factor N-terminal domain-containing protein [Gemmatales bacterium]MDW8175041.1 Rho termination factor N-terminal domain-containing protein [Gemmatales bacterium]
MPEPRTRKEATRARNARTKSLGEKESAREAGADQPTAPSTDDPANSGLPTPGEIVTESVASCGQVGVVEGLRANVFDNRGPAGTETAATGSDASDKPQAETFVSPVCPQETATSTSENCSTVHSARECSDSLASSPDEWEDEDDDSPYDPELKAKYNQIKRGQSKLSELQKMSMQQLLKLAKEEGVPDFVGLKKQDLIFRILRHRCEVNGLMFGEGTLEILPDGFGFLRSSECNYLPGSDDIYVSPSQIRRFGLRTGALVAGHIRPPKETERYFALLRVDAVNYEDPELLAQKVYFDDLIPVHPTQRIRLETDADDLSMRVLDLITPI